MKIGWLSLVGALISSLSAGAMAQEPLRELKDPARIFEEGFIQVVGQSEEGQSRVRALRAAEIVAKRDLLEMVQGLRLHGTTTVESGMLASDRIRTTVTGFLWGAVKCGERYDAEKGSARVCVRLNIRGKGGLYEELWPLLKGSALGPEKKPVYRAPVDEGQKPSGYASRPTSDGLILDVRAHDFKPALVNRILTVKNQLVFDPSVIAAKVLVERGCGGYTSDLQKAKALLAFWGAKRPMVLKCAGVDTQTDARISTEDAHELFRQDRQSAMLAQAKVVFLMQ